MGADLQTVWSIENGKAYIKEMNGKKEGTARVTIGAVRDIDDLKNFVNELSGGMLNNISFGDISAGPVGTDMSVNIEYALEPEQKRALKLLENYEAVLENPEQYIDDIVAMFASSNITAEWDKNKKEFELTDSKGGTIKRGAESAVKMLFGGSPEDLLLRIDKPTEDAKTLVGILDK